MTNHRKYNATHVRTRAQWKARIEAGEEIHCHHQPRCVEQDTRIYPGAPFDLGHRDGSDTEFTGPEHPRCNRGTARIWKDHAQGTTRRQASRNW